MLQAIISYMPVIETIPGIGSITYSKEERERLAKESINFICPNCGPVLKFAEGMKKCQSPAKPVQLPGK